MKNDSVVILKKVLRLTEETAEKGKATRLLELLKSPQDNETSDWSMCVPSCFNNALDIRLTPRKMKGEDTLVWTQGSAFSFKAGDTLYDTSMAYSEWGEALTRLTLCLSVEQAMDAVPERRKIQKNENIPRNPGYVRFSVLIPDGSKTALTKIDELELTQDDFVFLLIAGPNDVLKQGVPWKR